MSSVSKSLLGIQVETCFEAVESLLKAYVPVFNAASKECMPDEFAPNRARQLWRNAANVFTYRMFDEIGGVPKLIAGALLVEVTRESPPEFIPDEIFTKVLTIAGPSRRLFYLTALFRTSIGTHDDVIILRRALLQAHPGCHFYATIEAIRRKVFCDEGEYIGYEDWLEERREYYCLNT